MGKIGCTIFLAFFCGLLQASENARKVTTFIYSHGFTSCKAKAAAYGRAKIIPPETQTFNYSDAYLSWEQSQGYGVALDFWNSCIGQDPDINRLAYQVDQHTQPVALFGESRGATTILNYLGSAHARSDRVAAAVLDAPFDSVKSVLAHRLHLLGLQKILSPETVERALPYVCWNYNPDGIQPIKSVESIDLTIPLLFIASRQDTIVPATSSLNLYKKLRERGHEKVYLLMLGQGKHAWTMQGPLAECYRQVVHAFYEKHGIEHDLEYSAGGRDILENYCQPTVDQIEHHRVTIFDNVVDYC